MNPTIDDYVLIDPKYGLTIRTGRITKITILDSSCKNEKLFTVQALCNNHSYVIPEKFIHHKWDL
jgi:hypothetical protein